MGDMKVNFRKQDVSVTRDLGGFVQTVIKGELPHGLLVRMEDFVDAYGKLLHSAGGAGRSNPFHVSASTGPCYVICSQCESELDEQTIATLGKNSAMAAFGMPPVVKCPKCGNSFAVIVAA